MPQPPNTPQAQSARRAVRAVEIAVLAAISLRILVIAWLRPPAAWDGTIYAELARSLADGRGFVHWGGSGAATAFFPVGYPAAIAGVMALTGSSALASAYAVNTLSSVLTVCAAGLLGWKVSRASGATRAAWIAAVYPGAVLWTAATMTETLQCAWITLALAAAIDVRETQPHTRSAVARSAVVGVFIALAALVRPQAIVLAPVFGGLSSRSTKARITHAALALAVALLTLAPWTARNARALDGPALVSTNGGSNLLIGTLPESHGGYRELTRADPCTTVRGEVARDRCMSRVAVTRIQEHPGRWALLGARKIARTMGFEWAPVSYPRSSVGQRISKPIGIALAVICTACWWALLLSSVAKCVATARNSTVVHERQLAWGALSALASVVVVHAVFIADDRYHLVLIGVLSAATATLDHRYR